ncbi:hypothetical protein GA0004734_00007960 [Rhizobium sp. 9140]|nr:hypothetical protein GA0004734_00007960 [Rhizobium sp. 9140]
MELEWDEEKRQKNLRERGIDFASAAAMDPSSALTAIDSRSDYGEMRFLVFGFIEARLHVLCWTPRDGRMRVISLRKANEREQKAYFDASGPPSASH